MNNTVKIFIIAAICLLCFSAGVFGMGRTDTSEPQPVNGLENWDYSTDVSELPPGEYNVLVYGTDRAGNTGTGGPYNIYIDPSILIPTVRILSPSEGSRVGNSFRILGSAADDSEVTRVEIAAGEGDFKSVEGTEFWSAVIDSSAWAEGPHTLRVRSRDASGNQSNEEFITLYKDTVDPAISITSHINGSMISGKIKLEGTIADLNGIESGAISLNADADPVPLKLKKNKEDGVWSFAVVIDTRDFPDGAFVPEIEAVDGFGLTSGRNFLFYIDNSSPELSLLSPAPDARSNGLITLIGTASDSVGLSSLVFDADNGESGEIALTPGDPVWILPLDYSSSGGKQAKIKMALTDTAMNRVTAEFRIALDQDGDLPLSGAVFAASAPSGNIPVITGLIADDDGAKGLIEYSYDGKIWTDMEVDGPWMINLTDAVPGENRVYVRATDSEGITGPAEELHLILEPEKPEAVFENHTGEQTQHWSAGMILDSKVPGFLSGYILNSGETKYGWSLNGGAASALALKTDENGGSVFEIKLPKNLETGRYDLMISDTQSGRPLASTVFYIYAAAPAEEGQAPAIFTYPEAPGLQLVYPEGQKAGRLILTENSLISGWSTSGEIASVQLSDDGGFLKTSVYGSSFTISAVKDGRALNVTADVKLKSGKEFQTPPMNIYRDSSAPGVRILNPETGIRTGKSLALELTAQDSSAFVTVSYSIDNGSSFKKIQPAETASDSGEAGPDSESLYRADIPLSSIPEGLVSIIIRAEDEFGNIGDTTIPVLKDTRAPEIETVTSVFSADAGLITLSGYASDLDLIAKLSVSLIPAAHEGPDETVSETEPVSFEMQQSGSVFYRQINLTSLGYQPVQAVISAVDSTGNTAEKTIPLNIDFDLGRPAVEIQVPQEMAAVEDGFELSGFILDKEGVSSISYSINDGPLTEAGTGNLFTIPVGSASLADDVNVIRLSATDVNGLKSDILERRFIVSRDAPEVTVDVPALDSTVSGIVSIKGRSADSNGISEVRISHDNGTSFQKVSGTGEWEYALDSRQLKNGASNLLIEAIDNAGTSGMVTTIVNVDNSAPSVDISSPADGDTVRGRIELSGRVSDNFSVEKMVLTIILPAAAGNDETDSVLETEISARGNIIEEIDISSLSPGKYGIRIDAVDPAGNITSVSRVVDILPPEIQPPVLVSPLLGEAVSPFFSVQGYLPEGSGSVLILLDGNVYRTAVTGDDGRFRLDIGPDDNFPAGTSVISAGIDNDGEILSGAESVITYRKNGLWISMDNISDSMYVADRFVINGRTGIENPDDGDQKIASRIQLSLDGGLSFTPVKVKNGSWEYTLYSEELPDGELDLLAVVSGVDETAVSRCRLYLDSKKPELSLLSPEENARLYGELSFSGTAYDAGGLTDVKLSLRDGDKQAYETPSFVQGMYFDASALGATYFTTGLGLTFMDDNVKLQAQYGYAPPTVTDPVTGLDRAARFGGNVLGVKLLANLAQMPFSWLFGPEWSLFSATAALGANFSYFSSNTVDDEQSWGVILAGVVGQVELPKISFEDRSFLKYISLYWEGQMWLISSDVSPEVILLPSIGLRAGLF